MKFLKILLMLITGFWLAVPVSAQVLELTLAKARELALVNNPQIKLANEAVKKSDARVIEARAGLLPTFSAFSSYQRAWDLQTTVIPNFLKPMFDPLNLALYNAGYLPEYQEADEYIEMAFGLESTLTYGVNIQQPLFVG
ncbi:MAG: TolC family protein, partial [Candidatus Marinimicrobia bacterium]|nr:TolC family protein [Candidatus Neomarinimicrobiota bacterium]